MCTNGIKLLKLIFKEISKNKKIVIQSGDVLLRFPPEIQLISKFDFYCVIKIWSDLKTRTDCSSRSRPNSHVFYSGFDFGKPQYKSVF